MTDNEILAIGDAVYKRHINDPLKGKVERARIDFARQIEAVYLDENRLLRALLHEWHGMFAHCRRDGTEGADLIDRTGLMLQLADMMTPQGKVGAGDTAP